MARRHRPAAPRTGVVAVRVPAADDVREQGALRRPRTPRGARRPRPTRAGDRAHLPACRDPVGDAAPRRRTSPRQARHHPVGADDLSTPGRWAGAVTASVTWPARPRHLSAKAFGVLA